MSKEFYNYLAERTVSFFDSSTIKSGEKFILKLDSETEVAEYYNALNYVFNRDSRAIPYIRHDDETFETLSFMTGKNNNIQLIVIPEIDITNAYMTRLRNTVSMDQAIFIVCFKPIDSIAGGTESLQKEGMPFHKDILISDMIKAISNSNMSDGEKQVLYFDLKNKKNADYLDMYSIADYADILSILYKEHFDNDDFRKFGLFADPELSTISMSNDKELAQRIEDNYNLFKKVEIWQFGR